ncbi:MAG: fibronectin type III domain-containing protein [Clostridiales bacterium]|nr:fibronectin type III domain-containing protein [Clostridiales bacterium]
MKYLKNLCKILLFCMTLVLTVPAGMQTAEAASSLAKPVLSKVVNKKTGVKFTWKKVSKATGYIVYRKTGSGSYEELATIESGSTVSYTDTSVESGETYTYTVRAYNSDGKSGRRTGLTITYLAKPTLSKLTVADDSVTVKWKAVSGAGKYKVYRKSGSGSYKLLKTLSKSKKSYTDTSISPSTKYTYKVVAVKGSYTSVGATKKCTTSIGSGVTLSSVAGTSSTAAYYAIESDITLSGTGGGYHAKLVIGTGAAAVSFGIQFDNYAVSPYTGHAAFLVENVMSNAAGGQTYTRFDYDSSKYASTDTTYHLMITVSQKGVVNVYVNYEKVGSVTNTNLANQTLYCWIEGSARKNGDSVKAVFSNIQIAQQGVINEAPTVSYVRKATGISTNAAVNASPSTITIKGTLSGLTSSQDWDSAYDSCSGYVRFY